MIRRLQDSDLSSVLELVAALPEEQKSFNSHISRSWLVGEMAKGESLAFVAGTEVTSLVFFRRDDINLEITFLATHSRYQRQGQMTELLELLISENRAILLEVHEKNAGARKFYERHGFREVGLRKNYYSGGESAVLCTREAPRIPR